MIEGPNDIYMCVLCVDIAAKIVAKEREKGSIPKRVETQALSPGAPAATEH
jgi:hypothetical protein